MSTPGPDLVEEVVISLPDISLDELFHGGEASWQGTPKPQDPQPRPAAAPASNGLAQEQDRRTVARREPHEFKVELRLAAAGFPLRLVNLSSTGLLAETNQRLCPGRTIDVFLKYGAVRKVIRARVVRSSMHSIAPNPVFRAALQFEEKLTLQDVER